MFVPFRLAQRQYHFTDHYKLVCCDIFILPPSVQGLDEKDMKFQGALETTKNDEGIFDNK